jgi:hypothetical protein
MPTEDAGCPLMRFLGFGILAVLVGVPGLLFLAAISYGAILVPVAGFLLLAPFVIAYSALWGSRLGGSALPRQSQTDLTPHR